jgi:putative MATE family efflux protein
MKKTRNTLKTTPQEILEGPILKTLVRLSVPTILAFIFHTGFNFVDRFWVSRLGEIQFGAVGMAFTVQMTMIAIGSGLGIGTSSLIARLIGAKKVEHANRAADQALFLVVLLFSIFTIGGPFFTEFFFELLGTSKQMLPYTLGYINIILYGSLFQFFSMISNGILRGEGDTITPMRVMIFGTVVNIILDPFLIFGIGPFPEMGVQGAALATITARAMSCGILISSYISRKNIVKPTFRIFDLKQELLKGIIVVGGPAMIGNLLHPIGMSLMFFLLKPYGDASKAALTMGLTYQQLAILPIIGIAAGTLTMAGQNYGAKKPHRIRSLFVKANILSIGILSGVTLLFILGSGILVRVFSKSPEVVSIGKMLLIISSLGFPFIGSRIVNSNLFQGLGMGIKALVLNTGQVVLLSFPLAWLLSRWIGLNGIWWGMTIGIFIAALIGMLWVWITLRKLKFQTSK